ncbi:MAG: hypothetical protein JKY95_16275 [Planctomycetaceae bacterium]|nr:hypothetical protein [Planctomycetaceae bacterium]
MFYCDHLVRILWQEFSLVLWAGKNMVDAITNMTLRDKLNEAERMMRELMDHLDNGFIPKARSLSRTLQESDNDVTLVSDMTVRQQSAELIDSNRFSEKLYGKIGKLLVAIDEDVNSITSPGH